MTSSTGPDAAAPDAGTAVGEVTPPLDPPALDTDALETAAIETGLLDTASLDDGAEPSDASMEELDPRRLQAVRGLARAARLLERATDELSLAHYRVLFAIASGDVRATRIAARLAVGKPAISAAVESLCQRGLLARSMVEGDQRAAALNLTPSGRALLDRVETAMTRQLDALAPYIPDPAQLYESLAWLDAAIEADLTDRSNPRGTSGASS